MGAEEEAALAMVEEFTRYGSYKRRPAVGVCCVGVSSSRDGMEWGLPFVLRAALLCTTQLRLASPLWGCYQLNTTFLCN